MKPKVAKMTWSTQLVLVLLCALALKSFYSTATPDDLLWVLAPTTALVELLSDQQFVFEEYFGYLSSDQKFVIAVPCAGVNFLITAFLMLTLRRLWLRRFQSIGWSFLPIAATLAYIATLLANTTRIWFALEMRTQAASNTWLTHNQMHRLEGIVIYFVFLLLLFVLVERFERADSRSLARASVFPLLVYYATTLGIPLLNGSYRRGTPFWEHSAFVIVLPLLVILPLMLHQMLRTNLVSRSSEFRFRRVLSKPDNFLSRWWRIVGTWRRRCPGSRPQC